MMNSLTELYQQSVEQMGAKVSEAKAKEEARKKLLIKESLNHFHSFFRTWEPLQGLLGLKGEPTVDGVRDQIVWDGTTAINNLAVTTQAWMYCKEGVLSAPNLHLRITADGDERISIIGEIISGWAVDEYPKALGRLCSVWMEHYARTVAEDQEAEAKRLEQLETARRFINLARVYVERKQMVEDKIERWAVEWAAKLWEPHKLWKVRYVPVGSLVEEEDVEVETMVVMEEPGDIITALRQFPTATVTKVGTAGDVEEVEIPSFLDASVLVFDVQTVTAPMAYHCRYPAGRFVINVPPHSGRRPAPAPSIISWASYARECEIPQWIIDESPEAIAAKSPDELVEGYGWLMG